MRLTLRILGFDVLELESSADEGSDDSVDGSGTTSSYPVGFTPSLGDARWDRCGDLGGDDE